MKKGGKQKSVAPKAAAAVTAPAAAAPANAQVAAPNSVECECHAGTLFQCAGCSGAARSAIDYQENFALATMDADFLKQVVEGLVTVEVSVEDVSVWAFVGAICCVSGW